MSTLPEHRLLDGTARRLTGWCGIGMVGAILVNGPLSVALQRMPSYWEAGAGGKLATYLEDGTNVDQMLVFFALSNLIFVFGIGFFAGLRRVSDQSNVSDWVSGVVSVGSAVFLAAGLVSETLSTGIAVVLRSTPDYNLDANSALLMQGLWSTVIAQGQVALGIVIVAVSVASLRAGGLPKWLAWAGVAVGIVSILRPVLVTQIPLFIVSFQPVFFWIAAVSVVLLGAGTRRRPTERRRSATAIA
ncbi:hypothetical protein F8G81_05750 [Arthrobacter sp. CDRTa11]|uniref:hypothetical protein n=1 Tax=Arthrobacter sp. CDRTa11 TaxID=2651199 RepID=UPI002265C9E8|nr:hypothetical protein [Arthrobacter sp. CDRTa11]UZX02175.1 hypothetical protein F8G81_05750 [Arthrobacter sp. CDRTa11]